MGKPSKKKISRKKTTHHGKNKKLSRRKMKGGVAFNTSFSTSSLPSSTYIPLNPDVNENPSWNQIDARLLPAMKGGRKTPKKRGGKKTRKSRRKLKMKGGSLVGTDIVTGLNTTESNNVMAFGTTGGTDFMKDTLLAKGIDSGPYLSEKTVPDPMLV